MLKDYEGAKAAGMPFIAVKTGLGTDEDFIKAGLNPCLVLNSVACLPNFLLYSRTLVR